jgi:hypothetical protein
MNGKRYFGYFWFGYFTDGKASLLAHGFTTTGH